MKRCRIRMPKRVMALMLAAAMGISMTACGGAGNTGAANGETEEAKLSSGEGSDTKSAENETPETQTLPAETKMWLMTHEELSESSGELIYIYDYEYNEYGQLTRETRAEDGEVMYERTYTYDADHILTQADANMTMLSSNAVEYRQNTTWYDPFGNPTSEHSVRTTDYNEGEPYEDSTREYEAEYFYDAAGTSMGYVERQTDHTSLSSGYVQSYDLSWEETYDENGRLTQEIKDSVKYEYEYDENGNVAQKTTTSNLGSENEFSRVTTYTYEERLCKTIDTATLPATEEKEVIYRAQTSDASGEPLYTYYYAYNVWGDQTLAEGRSGGSFGIEYNEYNDERQITRIFVQGMVVNKLYDEQGREICEEYRESLDGEPIIYTDFEYDDAGNMTRASMRAGSSEYADEAGKYREYEYENDLLKKCSYFSNSGTLESYEEYVYAADGKLEKITEYAADGTIEIVTVPEYVTITVIAE